MGAFYQMLHTLLIVNAVGVFAVCNRLALLFHLRVWVRDNGGQIAGIGVDGVGKALLENACSTGRFVCFGEPGICMNGQNFA